MKSRTGERSFFLATEQISVKLMFSFGHWKQLKDYCPFKCICIFHSVSQRSWECGFCAALEKMDMSGFFVGKVFRILTLSTCGLFMYAYILSLKTVYPDCRSYSSNVES